MRKKKILITGANGKMATLVREHYRNDCVYLTSRQRIDIISDNEINIICESLEVYNWWRRVEDYAPFDKVLHFSEPVKNKNKDISSIVRSHVAFLSWACKCSKHVVYPLTAYLYDKTRINNPYVRIKKQTLKKVKKYKNISLPIVHPVIDLDGGIKRQIYVIAQIPVFNIFCNFNAKIPVVYTRDLIVELTNSTRTGVFDVYSAKLRVSEIFEQNKKINSSVISNTLKFLLIFFAYKSLINTLIYGRRANGKID